MTDFYGYRAAPSRGPLAPMRRAVCRLLGHRYWCITAGRRIHVCARCGRTWPA